MNVPPFEYMRFAKSAWRGARIALTLSGMTAPPADWLGDPRELLDLTDAGGAGTLFLRERIAIRYGVAADHVFVTPGASAAIHLVAAALCSPERGAVAERPGYPPLWLEPELAGAPVAFVERVASAGYRLEAGALRRALASVPSPAVVFTTNLHNPTGVCASDEDLAEAAAEASRAGARLACCELYGDFLGAGRPQPVAVLAEGAVSIGSVTKAFGLGALRVGWILCRDRALLERIELLFDHYDVNCAMPSLRCAAAMLDRVERFESRALAASRDGLDAFRAWARIESSRGRIELVEPAGGIVAFPRMVGVEDTMGLVRRVRERHGVQLTPGEFFGAPGHLRIGFGVDPALVTEALAALSSELPA